MGDFLRLLQTTADELTFIGGTPEKWEVALGVRVVASGSLSAAWQLQLGQQNAKHHAVVESSRCYSDILKRELGL